MNPNKRMSYMQKLFNPNQYRSNGSSALSEENFLRIMIESINKALNTSECPVKEKHVRKLLIGSFQVENGAFFWQHLPLIRLKENQIICWKFCHVLHKMLRDGHKHVLVSSYERKQILLDCGNMWRHVENGYGQLIFKYCTLLYNRVNFLVRNSKFPNDLKVSDEQLNDIGENNTSIFFDLSCEIFDSIDDILRLQELILVTVDVKKLNSMTNAGQCHLAPLLACIQDSSLLYDYSVKILFKLHSSLPGTTLEGHRDRFLCQHRALKNFYVNAGNLQYFRTLIQIPHLTDRPPNFLIASDLGKHVTPKVVMIQRQECDSPESLSSLHPTTTSSSSNDNNSELLVNLDDDDDDTQTIEDAPIPDSEVKTLDEDLSAKWTTLESTIEELRGTLELNQAKFESTITDLENKFQLERAGLESQIVELKSKLESEQAKNDSAINELRSKFKLEKSTLTKTIEELKSKCEAEEKMHLSALTNLKSELVSERANNQSTQSAMKKLVEDMALLKVENANLQRNQLEKQSNDTNHHQEEEDLLAVEMNETDEIIKDATRRIEELSEKSRKLETGIKLQVNEKISDVCSNLMKAVRNLIAQSRLLQREVVGAKGKLDSSEFYKRNSNWTDGFVSAANVVAMAARSLVDSADRTMSGQAEFSELAAAAHEVAAATTQLVVASRVKADKDSEKLKILMSASKQVTQCVGNIVDTARVCADLIEREIDKEDISTLSLHQTKKLEIETQVRLLELEDKLTKERIKLGLLRRQHYEREEVSNEVGQS